MPLPPILPAAPELWGGVEPTVNRVGDRFFDQQERNGHAGPRGEGEDLDRFAALGFRALRFPLLWERLAPDQPIVTDWSWSDRRLQRMRELGMRPLVGLLHHGSGPRRTNLLDPEFPELLADFARQAAERYPWVREWTPVNEPLTTARFSALYGHWYPHARDDRSFVRALLNQCRAVVLAMRAIRAVNPDARLLQTEDLGKTHSTAPLAAQADFENTRRWLTFDLLTGRVDAAHALWPTLTGAGANAAELAWFQENVCPPDTLGINHYVTSERFLDHRPERYPDWARSGNGQQVYADVVAVRAIAAGAAGPGRLLREASERYGLPIAVTELHLASSREEQMRWVAEVWADACALRAREGVDVRAVTLWSLLGTFDWVHLLLRETDDYERGIFDLRAPRPRPTALARLARQMAAGDPCEHPVLAVPGWWRRPARVEHHPASRISQPHAAPVRRPARRPAAPPRPLLITGATGTLGSAFARVCERRALPHRLVDRRAMDIADPAAVRRAMDEFQPWAVVNAAGYVRVDDAEGEPDRCRRENVLGPEILARACAERGDLPLVTFSSDLVFDGEPGAPPFDEGVDVRPLNVYGRTKAEMETRVQMILPGQALVIRTSAFFGPWDEHNFVFHALRALAAGDPFTAADDQTVSPTYVYDLVVNALDLLLDGESGVWHLANAGPGVTWFDLARRSAEIAGMDAARLEGRPGAALGQVAKRPRFAALTSRRGSLMPGLEDALGRFVPGCRERLPSLSARSLAMA